MDLVMGNLNIHEPICDKEHDILGRCDLADKIYERLVDSGCPQAIGIYGGWGTGKTSLLKLLELINTEHPEKKIKFLTIDGWKYEGVGNLFVPVIASLKTAAGEKIHELPEWRECAKVLLTVTTLTMTQAWSNRLGFGEVVSDAQKFFEQAIKDSNSFKWEVLTDDIEKIDDDFQKLIELALCGSNSTKLVLCIDNLDRCSPERVVHLLESIKNLVGTKNCVWVFAVDATVITSYISQKFQGVAMDGNSYLDKIVPEQYHLSISPTLDFEKMNRLLSYVTARNSEVKINLSKIPQIPKVLVPRRLIKSAVKFADFYKKPKVGVSPETVMALSLLYHTWPDFYQRLTSASKEHIRGILDNFFSRTQTKGEPTTEKSKSLIPLDDKFLQDKELVYFIQTVFGGFDAASSDRYVLEIITGLRGLRETGLP